MLRWRGAERAPRQRAMGHTICRGILSPPPGPGSRSIVKQPDACSSMRKHLIGGENGGGKFPQPLSPSPAATSALLPDGPFAAQLARLATASNTTRERNARASMASS